MRRSVMAVAMAVMVGGCGGSDDSGASAVDAMAAAAAGAPQVEAAMEEAEQFQQDRAARGDTVAMPFAELQKALPESIDGYTAQGGPSGSQQSMPGFSVSQTEQTWAGAPDADGNTPEIQVAVLDFGGTEQAYAMMAAPLLMGYSMEDDQRRTSSTPVDVPHSGAWTEYEKESKNARITLVTRYRYVITVEARNQAADQSAMVKRVAEGIARKFEGK